PTELYSEALSPDSSTTPNRIIATNLFFEDARPARSTRFPYTTLFRSLPAGSLDGEAADIGMAEAEPGHRHEEKGFRLGLGHPDIDRKSTRLNSSHDQISYAVFCLKKKNVGGILRIRLHRRAT